MLSPDRKFKITASDAPTVMGINPYKTTFELFVEKTTDAPATDDYEAGDEIDPRELGNHLQDGVLSLYETRRTCGGEKTVVLPNEDDAFLTCERYPLLGATLDATQIVEGMGKGIVEAKTAGGRSYQDGLGNWIRPIDEWEAGVPLPYQVQAQSQLMVTGLAYVTIPCLILSERRLIWHDVYPHEAFQARLWEAVETFWNEHVLTGVPPVPTNYTKAVKLLPKLVPERSGSVVLSGETAMQIEAGMTAVMDLKRQYESMLKACEKDLNCLKYQLSQVMGDAAEATIEETGTTYKLKNIRVGEKMITRKAYEFLRVDRKTPKNEEVSE